MSHSKYWYQDAIDRGEQPCLPDWPDAEPIPQCSRCDAILTKDESGVCTRCVSRAIGRVEQPSPVEFCSDDEAAA